MQKMIKKVSPAAFGHLMLEFEDGVSPPWRPRSAPAEGRRRVAPGRP
jgi:hypothetical protein